MKRDKSAVILALVRAGVRSQAEIARRLNLAGSTVYGRVRTLRRRGLIRNGRPGLCNALALTEEGRQTAAYLRLAVRRPDGSLASLEAAGDEG